MLEISMPISVPMDRDITWDTEHVLLDTMIRFGSIADAFYFVIYY